MSARRLSYLSGWLLALLPVAGAAQDNPWRVPSSAYQPYPSEARWLSAGWNVPDPVQSWARLARQEPAPPPSPAPARCNQPQRWAFAEPSSLETLGHERRTTDIPNSYTQPRPVQPQPPPAPAARWRESQPHYEASRQVVLGDFPPLEEDTRRPPQPSRPAPPAPASYGYRTAAPAPSSYDYRAAPPAYPAPAAGPTTLGEPWGAYGSYGYGGYGNYGTYGYPFASGVPAPYGWY